MWKGKSKNGKKKKFSVKQRFDYHNDRYFGCGRYGLEFGGTKHSYSTGFRDAFYGCHNTDSVIREFGKKSGVAYESGYKRGLRAAEKYFLTTGKQPSEIHRD